MRSALGYAGRIDDAIKLGVEVLAELPAENHAIQKARERGSSAVFGSATACRCQVLIRQGRLAEAEVEALSVLDTNDAHALARPMLLSCLLHTMIERTDPRAWETLLRDRGLNSELSEGPMTSLLLLSRAWLRLAASDPRSALEDLERMRVRDERSGLTTPRSRPMRVAPSRTTSSASATARVHAPQRPSSAPAAGAPQVRSASRCGRQESSRAAPPASSCCVSRSRASSTRRPAMSTRRR